MRFLDVGDLLSSTSPNRLFIHVGLKKPTFMFLFSTWTKVFFSIIGST
jgi:hypothetical protein